MSKAKKILFVSMLILSLLWVAFIFSNSLDNGEQSSNKSHTVTVVVNEVADSVGIKQEIKESTVRKLAHFTEFAVLGLLVCADILLAPIPRFESILKRMLPLCASLPVCFILASVDELIQKFSSGRACEFLDVLTDSLGALCGIALFILVYIICSAIKSRRQKAVDCI